MEHDERSAAIRTGERLAGVQQQIHRGRAPRMKRQDRCRIRTGRRRLPAVAAVFRRYEAHVPRTVVVRVRPAEVGQFRDPMHLVGDVEVVVGADEIRPESVRIVAAVHDPVQMAIGRRPVEGIDVADACRPPLAVGREFLT